MKTNSIFKAVQSYRQHEHIPEKNKCDYVYHSALEYVKWNAEDNCETCWQTNDFGTKSILCLHEKLNFSMSFNLSAEAYANYIELISEDRIKQSHQTDSLSETTYRIGE